MRIESAQREAKKVSDGQKKRPGRPKGHPGSHRLVPTHVDTEVARPDHADNLSVIVQLVGLRLTPGGLAQRVQRVDRKAEGKRGHDAISYIAGLLPMGAEAGPIPALIQ